jgi:hypothetical protein
MLKKKFIMIFSVLLIITSAVVCQTQGEKSMNKLSDKESVVIGIFAETRDEVQPVFTMAASLRQFGGKLKDIPVRLYVADYGDIDTSAIADQAKQLGIEIRTSTAPEAARWLFFSGKVYASAQAEREAEDNADVLVWMDIDTIVLQEPSAFLLEPGISFAYRPVMHNRSGTLYGQPPGPFWNRIYDDLKIDRSKLYEMTSPADQQKINAYYNAGLLVLRPEKHILRNWVTDFETLYTDSVLVNMCKENIENRIFLHQTALVGLLNNLDRSEMVELSDQYNYPLFFEQMFGAAREFGSIENVATLRYESYFRDPDPEWDKKLKGPRDRVAWLLEHLGHHD